MRLLDPRFVYIPAHKTDVRKTFERFGWRPTSDAERQARQKGIRLLPSFTVHPATIRSD